MGWWGAAQTPPRWLRRAEHLLRTPGFTTHLGPPGPPGRALHPVHVTHEETEAGFPEVPLLGRGGGAVAQAGGSSGHTL